MMPDRLSCSGEGAALGKVQYPEAEDLLKRKARKELQVEKEETEVSGLELLNLSFDVLRYIHDRVSLLDYMSFRSVSKLCRDVAPALELRTAMARSETQTNSPSPWLMYFNGIRGICRFAHPESVDRYSVEVPEALQGAIKWYCKDGWLLIGKQKGDNLCLSLFSLFRKNVIQYPEIPNPRYYFTSIAFSSPPTCQNLVVVLVALNDNLEVHIFHSRDKSWRLFLFDNEEFYPDYSYPVFAKGDFYFGSYFKRHGVLSLQGEGCDWKILEDPQEISPDFEESFLDEHDEEVFIVFTNEADRKICVVKLDPSTRSWKRVDNLGNYNLYVSESSALFMVAKTPKAKTRIYFPSFGEEDLVYYSLTTKSFRSFGSLDIINRKQHSCSWFKPTWS